MKEKSLVIDVATYDIEAEIAELPADLKQEFLSALGNYKIYVPEFEEPRYEVPRKDGVENIQFGRTRRADMELRAITHDLNGKKLSEKKILANIFAITLRMRAKVEQLRNNKVWLDRMEQHEVEEDARLEKEAELIETRGKPGGLRRLMRKRFIASTPEAFQAAPRTMMKMAEEMVVSPFERLSFGRNESGEGELRDLVMDPAMISDTLLGNLGLEEFIAKKKTPAEEKLTKKAASIDDVKEALTNLTVLKIKRPELRDEKYLRTFRTPDGYIVGTTHTVRGKQLFRADLVDATNRINHIHEGYEMEIPRLVKIEQVVNGVDKRVNEQWAKVKDEAELAKIKAEFSELVEELWLVNNKFKVQIRELLMECLTLESTFKRKVRGEGGKMKEEIVTRANPGAKRAKWNLVPVKIDQRIREIANIKKHLVEDEVRLMAVKAEHERIPFNTMRAYIESRAVENKQKKEIKSPVLDEAEIAELNRSLADWKDRFVPAEGKSFLQPYRVFAEKVVSAIEKVEACLVAENKPDRAVSRKEVADAVLRVFLVLKLQTFWTKIQGVNDKHLAGRHMPYFIEVRDELSEVFKLLRDKSVAGKVRTPDFDGVYHGLYKLLGELIKLADEGRKAAKEKDEKAAWKVKGQMHDLVAKTDIVAIVKGVQV